MGVLAVAGGVLLAVFVLVIIGIVIMAAMAGVFTPEPEPEPQTESEPKPNLPLTILDTNEGMAEANYYRSQNCQSNTEGTWACPENTISWTDFQNASH